MTTSLWAMSLWTGGFIAELSLLCTVIAKKRWRQWRVFSAFVAFQVLRNVLLLAARRTEAPIAYFVLFWLLVILDYAFQLGVIVELGIAVLKPLAGVATEAKNKVLVWWCLGLMLAGTVCMRVPSSSLSGTSLWDTRFSLFTSLLTCQSYLALSHLINHTGVQRRAHVLAIGSGLTCWSVFALFLDGVNAATGRNRNSLLLDGLVKIAYIGVTVYWARALWPDEPKGERERLADLVSDSGSGEPKAAVLDAAYRAKKAS